MTQSIQSAPSSLADFGKSLRTARERAGLSLRDVSFRIHTPTRVLAALEEGNTAPLGAPIFVLGQLRSYARLLDLEVPESVLEANRIDPGQQPVLVSHVHVPRYRRAVEQIGRRAIYVVLTASLVTPVWLATRPQAGLDPSALQSLDLPADAAGTTDRPTPASPRRTAVVASMTALPTASTPQAPSVDLRFVGDSWFELRARDGAVIEQALVTGGQTRRVDPKPGMRVVLGNATAVTVQQDGRTVDLAPFSRANVARFALSSDGSVAPVAD